MGLAVLGARLCRLLPPFSQVWQASLFLFESHFQAGG